MSVGRSAGTLNQGLSSVSLGFFAVNNNQGAHSEAIGASAGSLSQGD